MRADSIVSIDAAWGVSLQAVGEQTKESDRSLTMMKNSILYGETDADDCPKRHECWCKEKFGFMGFSSRHGGKEPHISSKSKLPMHKVKSYGTWNADTHMENLSFNHFDRNRTLCGAR